MGEAELQQLVMNILSVGSKNRAATDQSTQYGNRGLQDGKAEGDHGDGDRNNSGSLLCTFQCQGAQEEADEQAARVAQENRSRVEIKTEKAQENRQMHDTKTAQPQHRGGDGLNRELSVRTNGANVVVQAEQENQRGGEPKGGGNPGRAPQNPVRAATRK